MLESIFAENDTRADINRAAFESNGIRALNLMSSPGSGKTTVLAATLDELAGDLAVGVIEGDIATDLDAAKLGGRGAQISLLNTNNGFGGECHLDAPMVNRALQGLDLPALDLVIIENVGNLVCPAEFDVGEHAKAMVYSVTEGEDKPLKYPVMFRSVDVVLLNKIDLVPHLDAECRHLYRPCATGESDRDDPAGERAHRRRHGGLVRLVAPIRQVRRAAAVTVYRPRSPVRLPTVNAGGRMCFNLRQVSQAGGESNWSTEHLREIRRAVDARRVRGGMRNRRRKSRTRRWPAWRAGVHMRRLSIGLRFQPDVEIAAD